MIKSLLASLLLASAALAQTQPAPIPMPIPGPFETLPEQMSLDQLAQAHRASIEFELRDTADKMNAFAVAWNAFTTEYVEKHAVNRRKARAVHQAWARVENVIPR
jgi:hypothetical protein